MSEQKLAIDGGPKTAGNIGPFPTKIGRDELFPAYIPPYGVDQRNILVRTDGQRCSKGIEHLLLHIFMRLFKTHPEACLAARAALGFIFFSFHKLEPSFPVIRALYQVKTDLSRDLTGGFQPSLVLIDRMNVRIIKIPCYLMSLYHKLFRNSCGTNPATYM